MGLLTRRARKPLPELVQDLPEPPRRDNLYVLHKVLGLTVSRGEEDLGTGSPLASPRRPFAPRSGSASAQSSPRTKNLPTLRHTGSLSSLYQGSPVPSSAGSFDSSAATVASTHLPSPLETSGRRGMKGQVSQPETPALPPMRFGPSAFVVPEADDKSCVPTAPARAMSVHDPPPPAFSVYKTQPAPQSNASPPRLVRKTSSASLLYQGLGRSLSRMGTAMRRKASIDLLDMSASGGKSGHSSRHPSGNGSSQLHGLPETVEETSMTPIALKHATAIPVPILKPTPFVPPTDDDPDVSRPFNVHHDLHVSAGLQGLPPEWLEALKKQGVTEHDLLLITSAQQRQRAVAVKPLSKMVPPIDVNVSGRPKTPETTTSHAHSPAKAESITLPSPQSKTGTYRSTPPHLPRARTASATKALVAASPLATPTASTVPVQGGSPPPLPKLPPTASPGIVTPTHSTSAKAIDTPPKVQAPPPLSVKAAKKAEVPAPQAEAAPRAEADSSSPLTPGVLQKEGTGRGLPTPPKEKSTAPTAASPSPSRVASRKAVSKVAAAAASRPLPPAPKQAAARAPPARLPSPPPASLPPAPSTVPSAPSSARALSMSTNHSRNPSLQSNSTKRSPVPGVPPLPDVLPVPIFYTSSPQVSPVSPDAPPVPRVPASPDKAERAQTGSTLRRSESLLGRLLNDLDSRSARPSRPVDEMSLLPTGEPDQDGGSSILSLDDGQPLEDDVSSVSAEVTVAKKLSKPLPLPPMPTKTCDVPVKPALTIVTPKSPKSTEKATPKTPKTPRSATRRRFSMEPRRRLDSFKFSTDDPTPSPGHLSVPGRNVTRRLSEDLRRFNAFEIPAEDGWAADVFAAWDNDLSLAPFDALQPPPSARSLRRSDASDGSAPSSPVATLLPTPGARTSRGKRRSLSSLRMATDLEDVSSIYLRRRSRSIDFSVDARNTMYSSMEALEDATGNNSADLAAAAAYDGEVEPEHEVRHSRMSVSMTWTQRDSFGVAHGKGVHAVKRTHKHTPSVLAYLRKHDDVALYSPTGPSELGAPFETGPRAGRQAPPPPLHVLRGRDTHGRGASSATSSSDAPLTPDSDTAVTGSGVKDEGFGSAGSPSVLGLSIVPGSVAAEEYARRVVRAPSNGTTRSKGSVRSSGTSQSPSFTSATTTATTATAASGLHVSTHAAGDTVSILDADGVSPLTRMSSISSSIRSLNTTEVTVQRAYSRVLRRVPERSEAGDRPRSQLPEVGVAHVTPGPSRVPTPGSGSGSGSSSITEEPHDDIVVDDDDEEHVGVVVITANEALRKAIGEPNTPLTPDTPVSPPAARPESTLVIAMRPPSPPAEQVATTPVRPDSVCNTPATAHSWKTARGPPPTPPHARSPVTPVSCETPATATYSWKTPRNSVPNGVLSLEDSAWLVALHEGRV